MWVIWRYMVLVVTFTYYDVDDPFQRPRRRLRKSLRLCEKSQSRVNNEMEKLRSQIDGKKDTVRLSVKAPEGKQVVPLSPEKKRRLLRDIQRLERKLSWLATEETVWGNKIEDLDDMLAELRLNEAAEPLEIDDRLRQLFRKIEEKIDKVKSYAEEARQRAEEVDYLRDADDSEDLNALEREIIGSSEAKNEVAQSAKRPEPEDKAASLMDRARVAAEPVTPVPPEDLKRYAANESAEIAPNQDFPVKGIAKKERDDPEPA